MPTIISAFYLLSTTFRRGLVICGKEYWYKNYFSKETKTNYVLFCASAWKIVNFLSFKRKQNRPKKFSNEVCCSGTKKHLRQCLNLCRYRNSLIDHAISFNKRHCSKTATSIQKNKCYVTIPYYCELPYKTKRIVQYYHISTQFTPVNALKNSLVHSIDKQRKKP